MKNIAKLFIVLSLIAIITLPFVSLAQGSSLVPCGIEKYPDKTFRNSSGQIVHEKTDGYDDVSRMVIKQCGFDDLLLMVNNLVHFVLFSLALPISAIAFAYAGFLLVTSGGNAEQKGKAIKVFKNVGIGLVVAAAAWLIVSVLLSVMGFDGSWIGFGRVI